MTLFLHDMAHGGEAVGRHEGKAVFVAGGIPGERVRVRITEDRARYARAQLLEVVEPSSHRASPPCPYFCRCGGCHWQHIGYEAQLRLKEDIVRSLLQRVGGQADPRVLPTVSMMHPWAYRNHVQLVAEGGRIGYNAAQSHDLVPVTRCLIAHPLFDDLWPVFEGAPPGLRRVSLRAGAATGERMVVLEGGPRPHDLIRRLAEHSASCVSVSDSGRVAALCGSDAYHERVTGRTYRISAPSFFQVNTAQAEVLVQVVRRYLAPQPDDTLLDAYCGVGFFALSCASAGGSPGAGRVVGVESAPSAVRDAIANRAAAADVGADVAFIASSVEDAVPRLAAAPTAIVLDPPRVGCTPRALDALAGCGASRIVYVSCDPATLARDVARFSQHGYELVAVQPVDMFPQTYHIESVALLRRTAAPR